MTKIPEEQKLKFFVCALRSNLKSMRMLPHYSIASYVTAIQEQRTTNMTTVTFQQALLEKIYETKAMTGRALQSEGGGPGVPSVVRYRLLRYICICKLSGLIWCDITSFVYLSFFIEIMDVEVSFPNAKIASIDGKVLKLHKVCGV